MRDLLAALVLTLAPATSLAQQGGVEEAHARGMALRQAGLHAEAAAVFRELYLRTREPRALARWGLATAAEGDWILADELLSRALGTANDPWVQENRAALERNIARVREHLPVSPAPHPPPPVAPPLPPVAPPLPPVTPPLPPVTPPPATLPSVAEPAAPSNVVGPTFRREEAPPSPGLSLHRASGIVTLSLGGLGLVFGGISIGLRNAQAEHFNARGCQLRADRDEVSGSDSECVATYDAGNTWEIMSVVGLAAGGALTLAGAILLATAPRRAPSPTALRCTPNLTSIGMTCGAAF